MHGTLINLATQVAVKSRFPLKYLSFSQIPHRTLAISRISKIPFQTLS